MAGGADFDQDEPISAINVTPLVDVVLVLLVIFMLTAPVIYQSAIKVKLPQAETAQNQEKSPLEFTVTREGKVSWNKKEMSWEQLESELKSLGEQTANETAIVTADQATEHGQVVRLMDLLRKTGLTRFALSVENR